MNIRYTIKNFFWSKYKKVNILKYFFISLYLIILISLTIYIKYNKIYTDNTQWYFSKLIYFLLPQFITAISINGYISDKKSKYYLYLKSFGISKLQIVFNVIISQLLFTNLILLPIYVFQLSTLIDIRLKITLLYMSANLINLSFSFLFIYLVNLKINEKIINILISIFSLLLLSLSGLYFNEYLFSLYEKNAKWLLYMSFFGFFIASLKTLNPLMISIYFIVLTILMFNFLILLFLKSKKSFIYNGENIVLVKDYEMKWGLFKKSKMWKNVNFIQEKDENIAIIGKNGAGKTTLINNIIEYNSIKKNVLIKDGIKIGLLLQEVEFSGKVKDLIDEFAYYANKKINSFNYLKKFNLEEHINKKYSSLSPGLKQKIIFLIIKLNNPNLIIADELTNGLDLYWKELIYNELKNMKNKSVNFIVISHDPNEIAELCDKYYVIDKFKMSDKLTLNANFDYKKEQIKLVFTNLYSEDKKWKLEYHK